MNHRSTRPFLCAFALVMASVIPSAAFAADTFKIDAVHSEVGFHVTHLVVSKVAGHFGKFEGTLLLDEKNLAKSTVEVTIDAASISTESEARDKHLCSPDFFDVTKFPTLTFKSTSVKKGPKGALQVTGVFTMHGVSKTIVLPITFNGVGPGMKPESKVAGFEGTLKIKRSDYGIKTYLGPVGDEVTISLNVAADKI